MRITNAITFRTGTQNLQSLQQRLSHLQNQISTARRMVTPSDDPVAASQALVVSQQQSINQQFTTNQSNAASQLTDLEDRLAGVTELLQAVQERVVQAGNGTYSDGDRKAIAAEMRERFDELVGMANSSDGMGNYVFSGFRAGTKPFAVTGTPGARTVSYDGDSGNRQLQVDSGRMMDVSESGADVFMRIPQGSSGGMVTTGPNTNTSPPTPNNLGTGVVSGINSLTGYDGTKYELEFRAGLNPGDPMRYYVTTTPPGSATSQVEERTYTPGTDITLTNAPSTIKISISGTPAEGDTFTVQPANNQNVFETLDDLITALEKPIAGNPVARADFQNKMRAISENLTQAFDHISDKRAQIGARRNELEALGVAAEDRDYQYKADLSRLQDIDYTQALSDVSNYKMVLEAAQNSFVQTSKMSLFNFL